MAKGPEVNNENTLPSTNETGSLSSNPGEQGPGKAKAVFIVAAATIGMISNVASAAIPVILPTIGRELHIQEDALQWPIAAYSLTAGCFLLLLGRLADLYGRKRIFLLGTAWFIAWAIASGFARNGVQLAIFRAMQGIGSAALVPAAIGILAHEFPPGKSRSRAFATFSCGAPIGGSVGMLVGGTMTQLTSTTWRGVFFLHAGLAAISAIGILFAAPRDHLDPTTDRRVDWIGAALATSSLVLLTFVLGEGEVAGWNSPHIISLLVISVIGLFGFLIWEYFLEYRTNRPPLMKLSLWRRASGAFAAVQLVGFFGWIAFQSWAYWATLFYQNYLGLTPIQAMVRFIPMFVSGSLCNVVVALVVGRISGAILLGIGCVATASAGILFALIVPEASFWAFGFPAATLVVFGADFIFATGSIFIAKVALPEEQSLAGGVFNTLMQIGGSVGLAITNVVSNRIARRETRTMDITFNGTPSPQAALRGYRAAQWTCFAFAMFSALIVVIFLRNIGIVGSPKKTMSAKDIREQTEKEGMESNPDATVKV
ncbi:hypothetical protein FRC03_001175 [Tulasnella sp. 419]|nr:hypothetical protein FRC02_000167 [Tulasnella sp. 418]KAG8964951.1 hypothetical protein FRC03_001175 [Tulasnella sp. 419]